MQQYMGLRSFVFFFRRHSSSSVMATSRKSPYWREAASLILLTRTVPTDPPKKTPKPETWSSTEKHCNFNVLMLKRGQKSSFMANAFVYPGGVVSESDFDGRAWGSMLEEVTRRTMSAIAREFDTVGPKCPMLQKGTENGLYLTPDIAFRICAIRETFEESGVLVACHRRDIQQAISGGGLRSGPRMFTPPPTFDAAIWRRRVSDDSSAFMSLCLEYDIVPNIWALFEWSNWLTPVFNKVRSPPTKPKRFDTMFYICCMDNPMAGKPEVSLTEEISAGEWSCPVDWYHRAKNDKITLVGPQYYETSRLMSFMEINEVSRFARKREPLGMERWMPVSVVCEDGVFFMLPGDEFYPETPDYEGFRDTTVVDGTVLSHCKRAKSFHRGIRGIREYYCNIKLPYGLLSHTFAQEKFPDKLTISDSKL